MGLLPPGEPKLKRLVGVGRGWGAGEKKANWDGAKWHFLGWGLGKGGCRMYLENFFHPAVDGFGFVFTALACHFCPFSESLVLFTFTCLLDTQHGCPQEAGAWSSEATGCGWDTSDTGVISPGVISRQASLDFQKLRPFLPPEERRPPPTPAPPCPPLIQLPWVPSGGGSCGSEGEGIRLVS